jgi:dTDP-glucose 4,6-dehydratase
MKRLLLTGAGGFVGSHCLIHILHNTDWRVVVIDSFRHKGVTDRLREMVWESHPEYTYRVKVIAHDLTVPFSTVLVNDIGRIDYIINMASESHVDRSIQFPVPFVMNNISLALNMLELARILKPAKFLQVSTDEVYGPAAPGHDHKEWETHKPSNPYSASKAAQEDIAFAYWRTFSVPLIISNTMNIIGETQDPEKFVPMVISRAVAGKPLPIHGTPSLVGSRYYLHARNQADALLFMLNNVTPAVYGESEFPTKLHVRGELELSNLDMAKLVAKYAGIDNPVFKYVDFHATRPGHDLRYALDMGELTRLGWMPPIGLEESLRRTVEWTLANPKWMEL